jgi:hypothetical protein
MAATSPFRSEKVPEDIRDHPKRKAKSKVQGVQRELILAQRRRIEIAERRKGKKSKRYIARR